MFPRSPHSFSKIRQLCNSFELISAVRLTNMYPKCDKVGMGLITINIFYLIHRTYSYFEN